VPLQSLKEQQDPSVSLIPWCVVLLMTGYDDVAQATLALAYIEFSACHFLLVL
jgi:hypothetical protein